MSINLARIEIVQVLSCLGQSNHAVCTNFLLFFIIFHWRDQDFMYQVVTLTVNGFPRWLRQVINYASSASFIAMLFCVLGWVWENINMYFLLAFPTVFVTVSLNVVCRKLWQITGSEGGVRWVKVLVVVEWNLKIEI